MNWILATIYHQFAFRKENKSCDPLIKLSVKRSFTSFINTMFKRYLQVKGDYPKELEINDVGFALFSKTFINRYRHHKVGNEHEEKNDGVNVLKN